MENLGEKRYSSAMYFILEVEVAEILTTLCLAMRAQIERLIRAKGN